MKTSNPIDLLFGGMEKLGPGGNDHTLHVLSLLPKEQFNFVVDVGCGTGRQTLVLARELEIPIHALDSHEPFLEELKRRAEMAGLARLIQPHCMDMKDIPKKFHNIDLLWSEGAAYNIGFANALVTWAPAMDPIGFVVVSELSWLREMVPKVVKEFFESGYPDMKSVSQNLRVAEMAGYKVLTTHLLPAQAWIEGYYEVLAPRARDLLKHADPAVRDIAAETIREIEVFQDSHDSYGYVFYVLQGK